MQGLESAGEEVELDVVDRGELFSVLVHEMTE